MHDYSFRPLAPAPRIGPPGCSEIAEGLVVGQYLVPGDAEWLSAKLAIGAVVNLQDDYDLTAKSLRLSDLERSFATYAITLHHVPIADGDTDALLLRFDELVALMSRLSGEGRKIYLHCNAGMNRAPTVAIAFLHAARGLPLEEAITLVKQQRPCLPYLKALQARYAK